MTKTLFAGVLLAAIATGNAWASQRDEVMAPVTAFIDAVNKNDMKAAEAAHISSPTIIDEFSPHHWSGPTAFADWGKDFGKDAAANKITDGKLTAHKATRIFVEDDNAYVVQPTDYAFKRDGKPTVEHGTITYAVDKTAAGWRIAAWAYSW